MFYESNRLVVVRGTEFQLMCWLPNLPDMNLMEQLWLHLEISIHEAMLPPYNAGELQE